MLIVALAIVAAFSSEAVLLEAESFDVVSGWTVGTTRGESAPGGLSGGGALNSNRRDALACKTVTLPKGDWHAWVRVFDWGGAPGHYDLGVTINGALKTVGITEPTFGSFVWERWGRIHGGETIVELSRADAFNSVVDCVLFTRDESFEPALGPGIEFIEAKAQGKFAEEPLLLEVALKPLADLDVHELDAALVRGSGAGPSVWRRNFPLDGEKAHWQSGMLVENIEIPLPAFKYLRPGAYELHLAVPHTAWATGHPVARFTKEPTEMPKPCKAEIRPFRGAPAVWIDDEPRFALAYLIHTGDKDRHYRQMADIGVRFFTMGAGIGTTPEACDPPFLQILENQPHALMFPRIGITASTEWLEEHPEERVVFDDGSTGPQSMFSEAWLEDSCRKIEDYCRFIRSSPYADHVIGVHICSGVSAEWQSWGLWSDKRGDFSAPAKRAWRKYLTKKYETDAALAEAWDREVTVAAAEIPTRSRRETKSGLLRLAPEFQDVFDFYDYYWRGTANAIEKLAAAAKRGGGRDFLVGFFYGYAIQYGGKMQESQHLGMAQVMDCPDIDFFCSPAMYSLRQPGGTSTFMSFTESIKMRGKLWWDEADNRTHLARQAKVAPAADMFETLNVLEREFAHALTSGAAIWWFDMQGGWYDAPEILELFRWMREFGEHNEAVWAPLREVAVLVDDKSSCRFAPESSFLHGITALLAEMPRLGAPYDTYILSDIGRIPEYRLYIFPLATDLRDPERAAIEALKRDGKTLLFIGPGGIGRCADGRVEHNPALSRQLLGIDPEGDDWQRVDHGAWKLAWTPEPHPATEELRQVARDAGVHLYHEEDEAFYAGNGFVALHAQHEGEKTLHFEKEVHLRELFAEKPLEAVTTELTFNLKAKETRCFEVR